MGFNGRTLAGPSTASHKSPRGKRLPGAAASPGQKSTRRAMAARAADAHDSHHHAILDETCFGSRRLVPRTAAGVPLPPILRREAIAFAAEFCGTFSFLFVAFCLTQLIIGSERGADDGRLGVAWQTPASVFGVSAVFGGSAALSLWMFNHASAGIFNPAITLGLAAVGAVHPLRAVLVLIPAQFGAAIAAAAAAARVFTRPLLVAATLSGLLNPLQGCLVEMLLTTQLVFTAFFLLGAGRSKAQVAANSLSVPLGIGTSIFVAQLSATNLTGVGINPARSLATDIVTSFKHGWWVFYVGPLLGTALAFLVHFALSWFQDRLGGRTLAHKQDTESCLPFRADEIKTEDGPHQGQCPTCSRCLTCRG